MTQPDIPLVPGIPGTVRDPAEMLDDDERADRIVGDADLEGGKRADDGEPVGRADLDADIRRTWPDDG